MQYFKKPHKEELIVTAAVLIWIFIVNLAAVVLIGTSWPMFLVTIFFFALGADIKNIPNIFAGGTLGLVAAYGLAAGLAVLSPIIGSMQAFALLIGLILTVIILGGVVCPVACNNVAFAYLTAATIHIEGVTLGSTGYDLLVLWIGGAIILGGSLAAMKLAGRIISKG